jgi:hypothetical protein
VQAANEDLVFPDSLYGEEIRLLAKLQQPLPASAAPALRGAAWADQQLWTQLGAWAEQRHTGAAAAALMVPEVGMINPPTGVVAPYPAFFAGLANLSREAAKVLEKSAVKKPFDPPGIARAILAAAPLWKGGRGGAECFRESGASAIARRSLFPRSRAGAFPFPRPCPRRSATSSSCACARWRKRCSAIRRRPELPDRLQNCHVLGVVSTAAPAKVVPYETLNLFFKLIDGGGNRIIDIRPFHPNRFGGGAVQNPHAHADHGNGGD